MLEALMVFTRPKPQQIRPKSSQKKFSGVLHDVYQWKQELFDGSTTVYEQLTRLDSVNVIPVTPQKKIIVTQQRQPGTEIFLSLPGGVVDPGEEILAAAKRELLEESGCKARSWKLWDACQPAGKVDWAVYSFIAQDCQKVADLRLDAGEKIEVQEVTFEQFLKIVVSPEFREKELALKIMRLLLQKEGKQQLQKDILG